MTLTMNEVIQLILNFHYVPVGYWKDNPIEDPLVCQFVEEGYATLDEKYQERYVLSDKGDDFLHIYIKCISTAFIDFIKKKQLRCYDTDGILWFSNSYSLDTETSESLYDYISNNLKVYGYECQKFHQHEYGWGYQFKKVEK